MRRNGFGQLIPTDVQSRFRFSQQHLAAGGQPGASLAVPPSPLPQVAADAENFFKAYGGKALAQPNAPVYDSGVPPWVQPPAGYRSFLPVGVLAVPNPDGTDQVLQTFQVPIGWDGVINRIAQLYGGPGTTLGTGFLTWRLFQNGQPVRNFEATQNPYGYLTNQDSIVPLDFDGILIYSGDTITHTVANNPASTLPVGTSYILSLLGGYFWPRIQQ